MKEAKKALNLAKKHADMAEIWLDYIKDLNIIDLLKNKPLPVICVCKKIAEKGCFRGTNTDILKILSEASKNGAEYIDISNECAKTHRTSHITHHTKIIVSHHDYKKTPTLQIMLKKAEEIKRRGADIVKISVMSKSYSDTVQVIALAKHLQLKNIPHIIIAMGKKGALSRILTPTLGGTMMFAPISKPKSSALGQLTVKELKEAWSLIEDVKT